MSDISLSIIIPTKDRYQYLIPVIRYFKRFSGKYDFELIVEDNSSCNKEWNNFVSKKLLFPELKYEYVPEKRDIVANCDAAFLRAVGVYNIMLGDDDFVTEDIFSAVDFCSKNCIDSACFPLAWYNWPDLIEKIPSLPSLTITNDLILGIKVLDAKEEFANVLRTQRYRLEPISKVYHGIVRRKILENCYKEFGTFFPGYSPDIGNASALCQEVKEHVYFPIYAVVAGFGGKSAGGLGAQKRHVGRVDSVDFLPKSILSHWSTKIPYVWTGSTVWAASILYVLDKSSDDDLSQHFSFSRFYAYMLVSHPSIFLRWLSNFRIRNSFLTLIGLWLIVYDRLVSFKLPPSGMVEINLENSSILEASCKLESLNSNHRIAIFGDII